MGLGFCFSLLSLISLSRVHYSFVIVHISPLVFYIIAAIMLLYDIIDSSVRPMTGPFSWVPGLAMARQIGAFMSVYRIFNKAVQQRKASGIKRDDRLAA